MASPSTPSRKRSGFSSAAIAGEAEEAAAIDERLAALTSALFLEPNPIPVKWALAHLGLIGPGIRLPLTWFSAALQAPLREAMQQAGVL